MTQLRHEGTVAVADIAECNNVHFVTTVHQRKLLVRRDDDSLHTLANVDCKRVSDTPVLAVRVAY
jgi:hypothetical protein